MPLSVIAGALHMAAYGPYGLLLQSRYRRRWGGWGGLVVGRALRGRWLQIRFEVQQKDTTPMCCLSLRACVTTEPSAHVRIPCGKWPTYLMMPRHGLLPKSQVE